MALVGRVATPGGGGSRSVAGGGLEARAAPAAQRPVLRVHAAQRAQERQRRDRPCCRARRLAGRRELADQHLARPGRRRGSRRRPRAPASGRRAARPACRRAVRQSHCGCSQPAGWARSTAGSARPGRRSGVATARAKRRTRPASGFQRGLCGPGARARPQRAGAGDREHHLHARAAHAVDGVVERGPVVAGVVGSAASNAAGGGRARARSCHQLRVDAHDVDAEAFQCCHSLAGRLGMAEQQPLVLHPISRPAARAGAAQPSSAIRRTSASRKPAGSRLARRQVVPAQAPHTAARVGQIDRTALQRADRHGLDRGEAGARRCACWTSTDSAAPSAAGRTWP